MTTPPTGGSHRHAFPRTGSRPHSGRHFFAQAAARCGRGGANAHITASSKEIIIMLKRRHVLGAIAPLALSLIGCVAEMGAPGEEPVEGIETNQEELWKASWTGRAEE